MGQVIQFFDEGLQSLLSQDVQEKISLTVEASFITRPMPSGRITRAEIVRRVDVAKQTFRVLRAEFGWSEQRALDHLPRFLARFLDGQHPIPGWVRKMQDSESAMWGAEAAKKVMKERRLSALAKGSKDGRDR